MKAFISESHLCMWSPMTPEGTKARKAGSGYSLKPSRGKKQADTLVLRGPGTGSALGNATRDEGWATGAGRSSAVPLSHGDSGTSCSPLLSFLTASLRHPPLRTLASPYKYLGCSVTHRCRDIRAGGRAQGHRLAHCKPQP